MNDMQLLLVTGLPGCGKSTYLDELKGQGWIKFDDFKDHAHRNSRCFRDAQHYSAIVAHLKQGQRCVVADIDFCRTAARYEAEFVLEEDLSAIRFEWCYFAKDLAACESNIKHRNRPSLENDLSELRRYFERYEIPAGAQQRPVHRARSESGPTKR